MTSFLAIVKLTCRSTVRSHVFRALLLLLAISVLVVPNTLKGDGTAMGFIQLILNYSLGISALVLSTSVVWISCQEICSDIESGQFHLIAVKPMPRWAVLLGKVTGNLLLHGFLLLVSAVLIYFFVLYQFNKQEFSEKERQRVENEVFSGRRRFAPKKEDFRKLSEEVLAERLKQARADGFPSAAEHDPASRQKALMEVETELRGKWGEVQPGRTIRWIYEGLPEEAKTPVFVRYKVFSGVSLTSQDMTRGGWVVRLMYQQRQAADGDENSVVEEYYPLSENPEDILTVVPNEFVLPQTPGLFYKGTAMIGYVNLDQKSRNVNFQEADGPFLLVRETGFLSNYSRTVFVIFLGIVALCLVSSAFSAFLSLPIAIFCSVAYGILGLTTSFIIQNLMAYSEASYDAYDYVGRTMANLMGLLLIAIQDFFLTSDLASGVLVTWEQIGGLLLYNIVCRGLPLFLLGMWLYSRRELALAVKR